MNDQSTATTADPTTAAQPTDPVAALDELIAKAKAKRASIAHQNPADPTQPPAGGEVIEPQEELPTGPTPEEIQAQQLAELAVKEAEQAELNQRMLQEQHVKMHDLEETPQYQARKVQDEEVAKQQEEQRASQQGHVIHQIDDAKV